jgi:hypothetical protein
MSAETTALVCDRCGREAYPWNKPGDSCERKREPKPGRESEEYEAATAEQREGGVYYVLACVGTVCPSLT